MKKQRPMKALFVTGSFTPGGAELHLLKLLRILDTALVESHVIYFASGSLEDEYLKTGAELHLISRGNGSFPLKLFRIIRKFRQCVRQLQPDIIHSQLPQTNLLTCFALRGFNVPIVVSERGLGETRPFWEKIIRKSAYRRADSFITNSPVTAERMSKREGVPASSIHVVNNVVEIRPNSGNQTHVEQNGNSTLNMGITVIAIGGLRPIKGFSILIEAMSLLKRSFPGCRLLIAGEGPDRIHLETLINNLGLSQDIELLGYSENVTELLASSDVFVSSSISEGQSNSILEAMAAGIPIVATSVGGTTSLLENGHAGILVPPEDSQGIANALLEIIEDSSASVARVARALEIIRRKHSPEAIMNQYMAIFSNLILSKWGKDE